MPVLINDLEVEIQNPAAEAEAAPSVESPAPNTPSPSDMSIILLQQAERMERVRAH